MTSRPYGRWSAGRDPSHARWSIPSTRDKGGRSVGGPMTERGPIESWLTDMDGVLIHEGSLIPGADEFIRRLVASGRSFLVLTNNSIYTPRDLRARLLHTGIDVPEAALWTSALATAG